MASVATVDEVKRLAGAFVALAALPGLHGRAVASTVPPDDLAAAAYAGLQRYLAAIDDSRLTDADGLEVGACPLLGIEAFGAVASLGAPLDYVADPAVVMPLTIERLDDRVSVQCSFSGGAEPGLLAADITILDLGVSPEIERQLDQAMRGSAWETVGAPVPGELAGRCFARRDRDTCPVAWKSDDLAVFVEMSFGHEASDVGQAELVFGALLPPLLSNLAALG